MAYQSYQVWIVELAGFNVLLLNNCVELKERKGLD